MSIMILQKRVSWNDKEYLCDVTDFLNENLNSYHKEIALPRYLQHYIYDTRDIYDNKTITIRTPGRTVGCIMIDSDNVIISCRIYDDICECFTGNINEKLKRFIGMELVFDE